jgi:hypothetical protein
MAFSKATIRIVILSKMTLSIMPERCYAVSYMLSVDNKPLQAECRYAEWRYADCH